MKAVLSSRGSRGDVHPIIEIAAALHEQGNSVALCVPALFNEEVKRRGIEPALYPEDSELVMQELGSGLKAIRTGLDWFSRSCEEQFDFMLKETIDADIMVTSVNEIAAPTVAEYRGIPHVRIAYTPVLPGYHPPPLIPWQRLPRPANRIMWSAVNTMAGIFFKRFVNKKRIELGMEPMGPVGRYFTSNSHTIMTINSTIAPPCSSWDKNYRYSYTGYCYGDINGELDRDLMDFINDGEPPVYIGFGSVSVDDPERFTEIILESINNAGCRAVLGSGWTGLGASSLPEDVIVIKDTNHATLFPYMAGAAHHGGCGTTHTVARAGIPQFVMPQIADQFYWGHRIYSLGIGPAPVVPGKITVKKFTRVLDELLNNSIYRKNAAALGRDMAGENGLIEVVDIVSEILGIFAGTKGEACFRTIL